MFILKKIELFLKKKKDSFFLKVLICICISILPFILLEFALRLRDVFAEKKIFDSKQTVFDRYTITYTYAPYLLWRARPHQLTESFTTNSLGLRSPELETNKSTSLIVFVGGSTMWGYGVTNNEATIPYQVKKIIKEKYDKDIDIINLSENGYTSTQEFILWKDIIKLKPSAVVHFNGYNDLYTGHSGKPAGWNHDFVYEDLLLREKSEIIKSLAFMIIKNKVNELYLSHWLSYKLTKIISPEPHTVKRTALHEVVETYSKNMLLISQLAKANDINLIIVNQPNIFVDKKTLTPAEQEMQQSFEVYYDDPKNTHRYFSQGHVQQQEALDSLPHSRNMTIIDGKNFFLDKKEELYTDPVHINDIGSTIVATQLAHAIISQLK